MGVGGREGRLEQETRRIKRAKAEATLIQWIKIHQLTTIYHATRAERD